MIATNSREQGAPAAEIDFGRYRPKSVHNFLMVGETRHRSINIDRKPWSAYTHC